MFLNEGEKENFLIRESFGIKLKKKEKKKKKKERRSWRKKELLECSDE